MDCFHFTYAPTRFTQFSATHCNESRHIMETIRPQSQTPDRPSFEPKTIDLLRSVQGPTRWLWDGYIAAGSISLLTSLWKSGKTTLVSLLLAQMSKGGTFAGR